MTPSTVVAAPPVSFAPPSIGASEIAEVLATLESGWLTTGPRVAEFEAAFAQYTGARYAIALNSCTAALHLSLLAAGIGPGDEVITSPLTFCATANAILHTGATPVFADIDGLTGNLNPLAAAEAVTDRTKAILPIHYAGRPADMRAFRTIARRRSLTLIEDAAHCVEGMVAGVKVGSIADFTCFSFYATKNLTTGEGGMVTTNSERAEEFIRAASLHGLSRTAWTRYAPGGAPQYDVLMAGFKYNMMDLQAAIGLHQLARINEMHARRTEIWSRYNEGLAALPLQLPLDVPAGDIHARHLYTVAVHASDAGMTRDELQARLRALGIATSVHFRALHLHTFYQDRLGLRRGMFPAAETVSDTTLSLPLSAAMSDTDVDRVIEATYEALN